MAYLVGLKRRLNRLESVESQLDTRLINRYLRTNEPVSKVNMDMANKLKAFVSDAILSDSLPASYIEFDTPYMRQAQAEADQTTPKVHNGEQLHEQSTQEVPEFSNSKLNDHCGFTTLIKWG